MPLVQTEPKSIKIGSTAVKKVYLGSTRVRPVYPEHSLVYKMNADSSGNLYVPNGGDNVSGTSASYDWQISVDGGAETRYNGTGSYGSSIALSGYTAGTSHIITIKPTTLYYGWLRAYRWQGAVGRDLVTELLYDGSIRGYSAGTTSTGPSYKGGQFQGCTSLVKVPEKEIIEDTITTIGDSFLYSQFLGCTSLTKTPEEVLPSSVTSIGQSFRYTQYYGCTALSEITGWRDLSIGNSHYRRYQFGDCTTNKTVKVLSNVGYSSYDSNNVLNNSYVTSVSVPSAYLSTFKSTGNNPRVGITDSKFVGY